MLGGWWGLEWQAKVRVQKNEGRAQVKPKKNQLGRAVLTNTILRCEFA